MARLPINDIHTHTLTHTHTDTHPLTHTDTNMETAAMVPLSVDMSLVLLRGIGEFWAESDSGTGSKFIVFTGWV